MATSSFGPVQMIVTCEQAMRAIFDKIDADGSGELARDEVAAFIKQLRPSRAMDIELKKMDGEDEIADVMAQMDADGDGTVTFEEFSEWWRSGGSLTAAEREEKLALTRQRFNRDAAIRSIFESFDVDGSGSLDREEVRQACVKLGKVMTRQELDEAMYEMDADCSGTVDFQEFLMYVKSSGDGLSEAINVAASLKMEANQRAAKRSEAAEVMAAYDRVLPTAMKDLFDEVDADGNGSLDAEEVARFVRKLKPTRYMSAEEISNVMAQMDIDGDGSVTFDEFSQWWRSGGSLTAAERLDEQAERCGEQLSEVLAALEECREKRSFVMASHEAAEISKRAHDLAMKKMAADAA